MEKEINNIPLISMLKSMIISHAWLGHGNALFIELGSLHENKLCDGSLGNPKGDITLMIEYGWRIERTSSILCGCNDSKKDVLLIIKKLIGKYVESISIVGRLPELEIALSEKLWVVTFSQYKGQPNWAILFTNPHLGSLSVKRGFVCAA